MWYGGQQKQNDMGGNLGREAVCEACWRKCIVCCRNKGNQVVRIEKEKRSHWPSTNWAQIQIKQKKLRGRTKPEPFSLSCCCPDLRLLSRLRETIPGRVRSYEVKSSSCFLSEKREEGILTYLKPFSRSRVDGICTNSEQERQLFVRFQGVHIVVVSNCLNSFEIFNRVRLLENRIG